MQARTLRFAPIFAFFQGSARNSLSSQSVTLYVARFTLLVLCTATVPIFLNATSNRSVALTFGCGKVDCRHLQLKFPLHNAAFTHAEQQPLHQCKHGCTRPRMCTGMHSCMYARTRAMRYVIAYIQGSFFLPPQAIDQLHRTLGMVRWKCRCFHYAHMHPHTCPRMQACLHAPTHACLHACAHARMIRLRHCLF
jgi:hypothetical protein